ncbi:MAG: hypothetical protein HQL99_12940 [Magnetococcales bacterium]|nr:hypothetical protein [Magnetococcales bacterium]
MDPYELFTETQQLLAAGNAQGCVDRISQVMESEAESIPPLLARAVAHLWLAHYPEALADCNQVMRLDPENRHLYFIRGAVLRRMDRLEAAIANLSQAIDIHPGYGMAYLERAYCYNALERPLEADRDLQTALKQIEASLQGYCDSMGIIRSQMDATEALMNGDREYPRLFLSAMELEAMQRTLH